jgi:hypothetical protein
MLEMEQRTKLICEHWDHPEIYVNIDHLQYEQQERATWLDQKLQSSPASPNWDGILSALSTTQLLC